MHIRQMTGTDEEIAAVNDIYTASVKGKFITADLLPLGIDERKQWFFSFDHATYPVFLAGLPTEIMGWLAIRPYREGRDALRFTKEISYYIRHDHLGQGIGTALMHYALNKLDRKTTRILLAIVLEKNIASIRLLEKFDFRLWGLLPQVADFDGERCGHCYYGLQLA